MEEQSITASKNVRKRWDSYFHRVCKSVATKSPCLSIKTGAILVKDRSIVATGFNGPARGVSHCDGETCPRRIAGFPSGEGLHLCPAGHAEANCLANAARLGVQVEGTELYMNRAQIPCKDCITLLINAGIKEVILEEITAYDKLTKRILKSPNSPNIRRFDL